MTAATLKNILIMLFVACFCFWVFSVVRDIAQLEQTIELIKDRIDQNKAHICNLHREMD